MKKESPFFDLVGKRVIVIWTDATWRQFGADWIAYRVMNATPQTVVFQGVTSPNGARHDGTTVTCANKEIRDMIE